MADALFTPWSALLGGALIGLSASLLMVTLGRVAGVSGIVAGLVGPRDDRPWRLAFIVGLLGAGLVANLAFPELLTSSTPSVGRTPLLLGVAGVVVGVGTRLGGGCTSGHGVCGLSRFSWRSLVATLIFMATGAAAATIVRLAAAGVSP